MVSKIVEHGIENAVDELFDDKTARIVKTVGKAAVKKAGEKITEKGVQSTLQVGRKALIALGAVVVTVQVATTVIGLVVLHKAQDRRTERIVRRVLEEENQKAKAEA